MIIRPNRRRFLQMSLVGGTAFGLVGFGLPRIARASGGTWNGQVSASSDDGFVSGATGVQSLTDSTDIVRSNDYAGFRFTDVTVAQGATITSAYMYVWNTSDTHVDPAFNIHCEDIGNSPTFSATNKITDRTPTDSYANWGETSNPNPTPNWYQSVDIKDPIQEVIDRSDWASGNALSILWEGDGEGTPGLKITMYDGDTTLAAKLEINYS